ncbi:MAG: response regulator [Nitrosarchaeum sp.]
MTENNKVVIIDDNKDITMVLSDILEIGGYDVVAIGYNGEEALLLYKKHNPDFILLDVMMPVMDGIQALEKIKKEYSDANVIMITANNGTDTIQKLEKLKAAAIITKPFKIETVFETMKKVSNKITK